MATTDAELARSLRALPGWRRHDDGVSRTFQFDDFRAATRFVGRIADATAAAARRPAIDLEGGLVTVTLAPRGGRSLTPDDVAVARRIQRLVGDHRPPIGRAGPWSPDGPLTGIRTRPVGQAGP
jgi:4a-hydroxytetrahydrobiopterin dehydratase